MILQYTQAGVVAELEAAGRAGLGRLDSQLGHAEDHVSLGWHAGRKLRRALDGLARVLAGEALTAARGLDLREHESAHATRAVRDRIRDAVPGPGPDRFLAPEIEAVLSWWCPVR